MSVSMPRLTASMLLLFFISPQALSADEIEEIVVSADFRERPLQQFAASVTVLDAGFIEEAAQQHFEELVNVIPNFNWSGDGHRARYFQIRGVGELEQYQGAPNPSVGFLIDDIDYSGIGTVATLFDMQSVDVLRGPQGSRYGANALAGLVYMRSTAPTVERSGRFRLSLADDNSLSAGMAWGGALTRDERALLRISGHYHESDGFRDNPYLGRSDTNGRQETALRARLKLLASASLDADVSLMYVDADNGYDAFSLDNSLTMLSDRPGRDAQESTGASLRLHWSAAAAATLTSITSIADSNIDFSFDADWGNSSSWSPVTYDYVSVSERQRQTLSQEFRLASTESGRLFAGSTDWLLGLYALQLDEQLHTVDTGDYFDPGYNFADSLDRRFSSDYEATNVALFSRLERALAPGTRLSAGVRIEKRFTEYSDTDGLQQGPDESMWGGELSLQHEVSEALGVYATLAKGYKAGGINLGSNLGARAVFRREQLWSLELGLKAALLDDALLVNVATFFNRHDDMQVRSSFQAVPGDPTTFRFFTDNAARGETLGLEADVQWRLNDKFLLYASAGLLDASFDEFQTPQSDLGGRRLAHAPEYMFAMGGSYRHGNGFFVRIDASAKDDFYFDVSHDQKSEPYRLVNMRLGFEAATWTAQLWGRNIFDEDYAVRGFYFGNEPPDFPNALYTRQGDPRQYGLTVEWRF